MFYAWLSLRNSEDTNTCDNKVRVLRDRDLLFKSVGLGNLIAEWLEYTTHACMPFAGSPPVQLALMLLRLLPASIYYDCQIKAYPHCG